MASISVDIVAGSRAVKNRKGWQSAERIATVTGVTGTGQAQLDNALNTLGVPALGAEHPSMSQLFLDEMEPSARGPGVVLIRMIYRRLEDADEPVDEDTGSIEVGTTAEQSERNTDHAGALMTVTYASARESEREQQVVTVGAYLPKTRMVVRRRETGSPGDRSKLYVGKVNTGPWKLDPNCTARQWLCTEISGTSSDGGETYDVRYVFEYRGPTSETGNWDIKGYWRGSDGRVPSDLIADAGIVTYQIYKSVDFDNLNL
ncbi:MAG TPA: hypothetical protein VMY35_08675 [Phycisphaerae bacterium]|nr:hypothetical protein [Phycisphaerae bacterium]